MKISRRIRREIISASGMLSGIVIGITIRSAEIAGILTVIGWIIGRRIADIETE